MKQITKILIITLLAIVSITKVMNAQSTATATANISANIVLPISISKTGDLNFGNIEASGTEGTVSLSPSGERTASGGVRLPSIAGNVSTANFTVSGENNFSYSITLPTNDYVLTGNGGVGSLVVSSFTSFPANEGMLVSGTQTIKVAATLNVGANSAPGVYSNPAGFSVVVNYY